MAKQKVSCNTCAVLVSVFYSSKMTAVVREVIIQHLMTCDKCLQKYIDYEKKHPSFGNVDIKHVIEELRENIDDSSMVSDSNKSDLVTEITSSFSSDSNTDGEFFNPTKWQDAAGRFDIETLMNLKTFRDLINSHDYQKSHSDLDYSDFYKYVTKKIAKHIDLLEACLLKECVTNS